jgi:hypothetical protein
VSTVTAETQALHTIAAKQRLQALRRRSQRRAHELRRAPQPSLRFGAQSKSLPRLHAEDAMRGVIGERYELPRRLT